jgi:hypothetical protein
MSTKRIVAVISVFALSVIMLFVYPSTEKSMYAGQLKSTQKVTTLTNVHQITVSSNDVIAQYFGKGVVEKIMKQPGCVAVRIYYGKRANGKSGFMFIGVDKNGRDIEPTILTGPSTYCPPICND